MTPIDKQPSAQAVTVNSGEIFAVGECKSVIFAYVINLLIKQTGIRVLAHRPNPATTRNLSARGAVVS